jgi:hypothetical protein
MLQRSKQKHPFYLAIVSAHGVSTEGQWSVKAARHRAKQLTAAKGVVRIDLVDQFDNDRQTLWEA